MRSRRTPEPASWLSVIESASAGFTGTARLVRDEPVDATETAFRGSGYALRAEVEADQELFGSRPEETVVLNGQTRRPPDQREDPHAARFPPDSLRAVPYWDQAREGAETAALCLLADPPLVRSLLGPEDDLPDAVRTIRGWVETAGDHESEVERRLSDPTGAPAVCYVAGFELLARTTGDLPGLLDRFLRFPGRPGAAARGVLHHLHLVAGRLPDHELVEVARRLLGVMADEHNSEALVSYLTWFDAHGQRIAALDPGLAADVRAEAERISTRELDAADGAEWRQEVARFAGSITVDGHP